MDFSDFVEPWEAADALMEAGTSAGLEPADVSALLITDEG